MGVIFDCVYFYAYQSTCHGVLHTNHNSAPVPSTPLVFERVDFLFFGYPNQTYCLNNSFLSYPNLILTLTSTYLPRPRISNPGPKLKSWKSGIFFEISRDPGNSRDLKEYVFIIHFVGDTRGASPYASKIYYSQ